MWQSIREDALTVCPTCEGPVQRIYSSPATYGVGRRGAETTWTDAKERTLDKDRPAYKRLRDEGHQPRGIDGCDRLEATAVSNWHIATGQPHPDNRVEEAREAAKEIMRGEWQHGSPRDGQ